MKIGFIGYGEAAYNISFGLSKEGLKGIRATDAMMNDSVWENRCIPVQKQQELL